MTALPDTIPAEVAEGQETLAHTVILPPSLIRNASPTATPGIG